MLALTLVPTDQTTSRYVYFFKKNQNFKICLNFRKTLEFQKK